MNRKNEETINKELYKIVTYINHVAKAKDNYERGFEKLCERNQISTKKVVKTTRLKQFEDMLKVNYQKAMSYYDKIKEIKDYYEFFGEAKHQLMDYKYELEHTIFKEFISIQLQLIRKDEIKSKIPDGVEAVVDVAPKPKVTVKSDEEVLQEIKKLQPKKEEPKQESKEKPVIKGIGAGKIRQFKNGTLFGGYRMSNPARNYIELSERAEIYLRDTEGVGIVTSGAEGSHAKGIVSHASGNKLDVQGLKGIKTSNIEYAQLCIHFLKNPETAYINLESFNQADVDEIMEYIKNNDSESYKLANTTTQYSPGSKTWFNKGKLLCALTTKYDKHLDIGIKPNAYTNNNSKDE